MINDINKQTTPTRPPAGPGLSQLRATNKGNRAVPEHFCTNCRMKRHTPCGCKRKNG